MNCFQPQCLAALNVLDVIVDKECTLGVDAVSVEQNVIKLRERLSRFLNARYYDAFEPVKEVKCV